MEWQDGRRRVPLPIDQKLEEVLGALESTATRVVVVAAETGAGKTTRIPQALALAYPRERVIVTQPRRAAVRWNAKRVAEEMGSPLGGLVGYRLSRESPFVSSETQILFQVDQSLVTRIRESGGLPRGTIVIDEAHERSINLDLLLGLVRELLPASPQTRVVVTSATIDTQKFSAFFGGAPIVSVPGRMFSVETPGIIRLVEWEHHSQGAARAATGVLEKFLGGSLTIAAENGTDRALVTRGTVLVLLPGKEDITNVMSALCSAAQRMGGEERVKILACHGESTQAEQDAVQAVLRPGVLRIVCGTEILRTSVTVREVVGVIDSLQIKRFVTDAKGIGHLKKVPVSKAEADQGKGRAGRTQPGFYIPVSFGREYEQLAPYPQPAILREPVTHVALQVAEVGRSLRTFSLIDRPEEDRVEVAIKRLQRIGALDGAEQITPIGRLLTDLPLEPERARVLIAAKDLGILPEAAVAVAVLEAEGIFFLPRDRSYSDEDKARELRKSWGGESGSDFAAVVRAYRAFKAKERRLCDEDMSRREREDALFAWCKEHFLNLKRLRRTDEVMAELSDALAGGELAFNGASHEREFDASALTKALASGHVDNVARRLEGTRFTRYASAVASEFDIANASPCPRESLILVEGFTQVPVGRRRDGMLTLALHAAPLKAEWLPEIMPQLCVSRRLGDAKYDLSKDEVLETEVAYYGDLEIERKAVVVESVDVAVSVLASWLAEQTRWGSQRELLGGVIEENKKRQEEAAELNRRIGEECFKVYSKEELEAHYRAALQGARKLADVTSTNTFRLSALDEVEAMKVRANAPDEIEVVGLRLPVSYSSDRSPSVTVPHQAFRNGAWKDLPDGGVILPNGRSVSVELRLDNYSGRSLEDANVQRLKGRVYEFLLGEEEQEERAALRKRINELLEKYRFESRAVGEVLHARLYAVKYGNNDMAAAGLRALVAEVEAAIAAAEAEKAKAEMAAREADARREAANAALREICLTGVSTYIWVPTEGGEVAYVLGGKTSKIGNFVVLPHAGEPRCDGPYCLGDSKYRLWVPFKFGVESRAQDFSGKGNLQSEVELFVPKGMLAPGVYGVGEDEQGQYFFPEIHHDSEGSEIIPDVNTIRKIRVERQGMANSSRPMDDRRPSVSSLEELRTKWAKK